MKLLLINVIPAHQFGFMAGHAQVEHVNHVVRIINAAFEKQ